MEFDEIVLKIMINWPVNYPSKIKLPQTTIDTQVWEALFIQAMRQLNNNSAPQMIRLWADTTGQSLEQEIIDMVANNSASQRFLYTLLESYPHIKSKSIARQILNQTELANYSRSLIELAYTVSEKINYTCENLKRHCPAILTPQINASSNPSSLSFTLLAWAKRFDSAYFDSLKDELDGEHPLHHQLQIVDILHRGKKELYFLQVFSTRYLASTEQTNKWLQKIAKKKFSREALWQHLKGFTPEQLSSVDLNQFTQHAELSKFIQQLTSDPQPAHMTNHIQYPDDTLVEAVRKFSRQTNSVNIEYYQIFEQVLQENTCKNSIDEGQKAIRNGPDWIKGVWLAVLAKSKHKTHATLRTLEFLDTEDELIIHAAIDTLAELGQPKGGQELLYCLTRAKFRKYKLKIAEKIEFFEMKPLADEIRSSLHDLSKQQVADSDHMAVIEILSEYLDLENKESLSAPTTESQNTEITKETTIFPNWDKFSTPVKRALRTALYFHEQILKHENRALMDLAPIIDMQYKAVEVFFREHFESTCVKAIQQKDVQRTLDLIGYARPVKEKMDQFEGYLKNLDYICQIPYFSKAKLRKILRSICGYRPGKRFTLDGVKAYALLFLTFGREDCPYGLSNRIRLNVKQEELLQYCSLLHEFQDTRNRAVHEGIQLEQQNELDQIWKYTASILEFASQLTLEYKPN